MAVVYCEYYSNGVYYYCHIRNQRIPDGPIFLQGTHMVGMTNCSVKRLEINDCDMNALPPNLQDLFPGLVILSVFNCTLKSIGREHIGKWEDLQDILIKRCKLKRLRGDTFRGLKKLQTISIYNNELEEIEPDILDGLERLTYVDLRRNININMIVDGSDFRKIKKEIVMKCKPKWRSMPRLDFVEPKEAVEQLGQQVRKLTAENVELKLWVKNYEVNAKKKLEGQRLEGAEEGSKLKKLLKVLTDEAFKDFTINIGDSAFELHKSLFAAQSETLAEMFRSQPGVNQLSLDSISESAFRAVHEFIYTNQLLADVNYCEVFEAAAWLKIDDLIATAADHLLANINEGNSFDILVLSNKFEHEQLRQKAFESIRAEVCCKFDRKLDDELAKQPEKLRKILDARKKLDQTFDEVVDGV